MSERGVYAEEASAAKRGWESRPGDISNYAQMHRTVINCAGPSSSSSLTAAYPIELVCVSPRSLPGSL